MKLTRIRVEQLKQFRQPLIIEALEPGLNIFTGPNEAGKSTLVAAIRAAFLERYRSNGVEELRPWGDASAAPKIEIDFTVGARHFALSKSFLGKKRCELRFDGRQLDGGEAEDYLAQLLGFEHASKGASKAEHWGIPGLLWIEQGAAQQIRQAVTHATDYLRGALDQSLGEITSSGGDEVLDQVAAARGELLTQTTNAPRGVYAEAIAQSRALAQHCTELETKINSYRLQVDRLASLQAEQAQESSEQPWVNLRNQQAAARTELERIQAIEKNLRSGQQRSALLARQLQLLHEQLHNFTQQEQALATRTQALEQAALKAKAQSAEVSQWATQHTSAVQRLQDAIAAVLESRQYTSRHQLGAQVADATAATQTASAALARAKVLQAEVAALQTQWAVNPIEIKLVQQLREQHQALRELHFLKTAAATTVRFTLNQDRTITIGEDAVNGAGEQLLLTTTHIDLGELGSLDVIPGGADLNRLREQETTLSVQHQALLSQLDVPTLAAAEERLQAHSQTQEQLNNAKSLLSALAPSGIEHLLAEHNGQLSKLQSLQQQLAQLPALPATTPPLLALAEGQEDTAKASLAQIDANWHTAQLSAANTNSALEGAERELRAQQALLAHPDRAERLSLAQHQLNDTRAEETVLQSQLAIWQEQIGSARPDILAQDIERLGRSAEQLEKRFSERQDVITRLHIELQSAGAQGLEEQYAEAARDLAHIERRVEQLRHRAETLDYLLKLLQEKRQALTRRLQAPLQRHLDHYLQLLFPNARLSIDESLSPGALTRNSNVTVGTSSSLVQETTAPSLEALSFGAREQMGVISRLAYADLLKEAGQPTLVILDDALVHSDMQRLDQMKRILFDAATRHQVLLFTCHPTLWQDAGVRLRSIADLRASAATNAAY